jgi:hypothetical protein
MEFSSLEFMRCEGSLESVVRYFERGYACMHKANSFLLFEELRRFNHEQHRGNVVPFPLSGYLPHISSAASSAPTEWIVEKTNSRRPRGPYHAGAIMFMAQLPNRRGMMRRRRTVVGLVVVGLALPPLVAASYGVRRIRQRFYLLQIAVVSPYPRTGSILRAHPQGPLPPMIGLIAQGRHISIELSVVRRR